MSEFIRIKSLGKKEEKKVLQEIEKRIAEKKKGDFYNEREVREITEMRLHPLPDIQDVQGVYEDHLYPNKK
ncbi:MAG: hypothetical protein WCC06_09815 [Candidatus Aminicenantales bacterium]